MTLIMKKGPPVLPFPWLLLLLLLIISLGQPLTEDERLAGWTARNYTWPPSHYIPSSSQPIWEERLEQIKTMKDPQDRFKAYTLLASCSLLGRNLTQFGWGLTRAPDKIVRKLRHSLEQAKPWKEFETETFLAPMGLRYQQVPYFVDTLNINVMILQELQGLHEAWVGMKLEPQVGFGLRVYRNQSQLLMHIDNPRTHIVSSILHVGSDKDWPLAIQDYEGNTIQVHLRPGDMLLYESSRILHGRPHVFDGEWYSSLFLHYRPVGYWEEGTNVEHELHYAVPPHWEQTTPTATTAPLLAMHGYGLEELHCAHGWCGLDQSQILRGPGVEGTIQTTRGTKFVPTGEPEL
jgi:hypothetical protein